MRANVFRFELPDPGDVSGLRLAIDDRSIDPATIVGVIGKTHGNGLVNDYTRGYVTQSLSLLIAEKTGNTPDAIRRRVPFIFSRGVEGVLSPHYVVFTVSEDGAQPMGKALAIWTGLTLDLRPEDIGRQSQIDLTAVAVEKAMARAGIADPADVHFVQVKGPAFALADIVAAPAAQRQARKRQSRQAYGFRPRRFRSRRRQGPRRDLRRAGDRSRGPQRFRHLFLGRQLFGRRRGQGQ
jgi:cyanuric acid amidohydrolase